MFPVACSVIASLFLCADPPPKRSEDGTTPRKPHPFAPSLPETTQQEEDRFDQVIDRFILADTGKLNGPETKKAMEEFHRLPPESVFALIRGMNRAAKIDHSCPALVIAKRLAVQLRSSADMELLTFSRENIGAGVGQSRHGDVIKDLKVAISRRISAVAGQKKPVIRDGGR